MAFKMKGHTLPGINQRSEGKNMADGRAKSSAFQLMGEWIELPDGTKTQVSKKDAILHNRKIDKAQLDATEIGRDFSVNTDKMDSSEFVKTKKGKKIQQERNDAVTDLGKTTTTGQESINDLKSQMSDADKKEFGGIGNKNYQLKYPDRAKAFKKAKAEKLAEKTSGVADKQRDLNAESRS